eukprot:3665203-Rhodomonas_salina.1
MLGGEMREVCGRARARESVREGEQEIVCAGREKRCVSGERASRERKREPVNFRARGRARKSS